MHATPFHVERQTLDDGADKPLSFLGPVVGHLVMLVETYFGGGNLD